MPKPMRTDYEKSIPDILSEKSPERKPAISKSQTGDSSNLSANAEVISYSMGTSLLLILTVLAESGL
jgi:hypothetical protein